jgi:hypothetical protein
MKYPSTAHAPALDPVPYQVNRLRRIQHRARAHQRIPRTTRAPASQDLDLSTSVGAEARYFIASENTASRRISASRGSGAHEKGLASHCTFWAVSGTYRLAFLLPGARWSAAGGLARGDCGIVDRNLRNSAMLIAMRIRNMAMAAAISAIVAPITMPNILI